MKTFEVEVIVTIQLPAFTETDAIEAVDESIREIEALGGVVKDSRVKKIEEIT